MNTMKTVMIAATTVLSVGVVAAMAQDRGNSSPGWQGARAAQAARARALNSQPIPLTGPVQAGSSDAKSGSSDMDVPGMTGANHSATYILQHHLFDGGNG
jgi:hypothetical protein